MRGDTGDRWKTCFSTNKHFIKTQDCDGEKVKLNNTFINTKISTCQEFCQHIFKACMNKSKTYFIDQPTN